MHKKANYVKPISKKSNVVKVNGDIVGTARQLNHSKHVSSMNWIAILDSEPQLAIKLHMENMINHYGLEAVELIANFVINNAKKGAA